VIRCSKCGVEKSAEEFPRRADRPSGRGTVCLACGRIYRRAHYLQNIAYYIQKAHRGRREHRQRNYERLIEYLRTHPCVDCGETDVRVLQFDHLDPSQKTANVSYLVLGSTWRKAIAEIEKCVVRCGNCHRRKTILDLRARRDDGSVREESGSWLGALCEIMDAGPLAQWIEQPPSKRQVFASSSLARPAASSAALVRRSGSETARSRLIGCARSRRLRAGALSTASRSLTSLVPRMGQVR